MSIIIEYIVSALILFPILIFFMVFTICRKRKMKTNKSFGYAADVTTVLLFFSVSLSISSLWGMKYSVIVFVVAVILAMVFTYIDWRTKKEIEILPLFKKIWRIFFILLSIAYFIVWIVGLIQSIIEFVAN